jgi:hypothetical protein
MNCPFPVVSTPFYGNSSREKRLDIMASLHQNPLPQRVLTFYWGLTHAKNRLLLVFPGAKPGVCLHYETQQTTPKGVTQVKIRCSLHEIYELPASAIVIPYGKPSKQILNI